MQTDIPIAVISAIKKYDMLSDGMKIILALSGGADSVCLLHMLLRLQIEYSLIISAVHVNHGIRGEEADADEAFVKDICAQLGVELDIYHYDVPAEAARLKLTLEEAGRLKRYDSFEKSRRIRAADRIAVAHNLNDNAETVLMRIFRGTGLKGLAGIAPVRGNIIRPLLYLPRTEIDEFCQVNALNFRVDSTNLKNIYTRNIIRLELMPLIENKLAPGALFNISRMSQLAAEEEQYLQTLAVEALSMVRTDSVALSVPRLLSYPDVIKRRVLRLFFLEFTRDNHDISYGHVSMAMDMLYKSTGKTLCLPLGLTLAKRYDELVILQNPDYDFCYELPLDTPVFVPEAGIYVKASMKKPDFNFDNGCTKTFSCDKMDAILRIRSRKPGDKIFVRSMGGHKKIKDYFIDIKMPRQLRASTALLACGDKVLWIMDKKNITSDLYKASDGNILYIQKWEACQ